MLRFKKRNVRPTRSARRQGFQPRIEILEGRLAPCCATIAVPDFYSTPANTPVTGDVMANDFFLGGGTPDLLTPPVHGQLAWRYWDNGLDFSFTYTPDPGFTGIDTFTYGYVPYCFFCFPQVSNPATVTITVGDGAPSAELAALSIDDALPVVEGNTGSYVQFTVRATPSNETVTVDYDTGGGTHLFNGSADGTDFVPTSGTLTFNPNETNKTILVPINGDITYEPDEAFYVRLSNPVNAQIADREGWATITNDDPVPTVVSISDVTRAEGDTGTTPFDFTVSLSNPSYQPIEVRYGTSDSYIEENCIRYDNAHADYQAAQPFWNRFTFNPGEASKTVTIPVYGDQGAEPDECFTVYVGDRPWESPRGTGKIVNDDGRPTIKISDARKKEGQSGLVDFVFTVSLSHAFPWMITVDYATADAMAKAGEDYQAVSGTLTFNPGETSKTITVSVYGNSLQEANETFFVNLSNAGSADILDAQGIATILNDD